MNWNPPFSSEKQKSCLRCLAFLPEYSSSHLTVKQKLPLNLLLRSQHILLMHEMQVLPVFVDTSPIYVEAIIKSSLSLIQKAKDKDGLSYS
jgi:hypothetical protein